MYESQAQEMVMLRAGPRIAACSPASINSFKKPSEELRNSECAFKPITPADVMKIIRVSKPAITQKKTKRYAAFEEGKD